MIHIQPKYYLPLISLAGILIGALFLLPPANASALSGSQWRAGNIADDSVFFDGNTMSANDIQAFMNSKVPSCDTNGSKIYSGSQTRAQYGASVGYPAPYTCLRDYTENTPSKPAESGLCANYDGGTKSSAQIIFDVAHSCSINPQVLLILLQKEQSLVTDDWPFSRQFKTATGYGCPDTAACDSQYFGFFNQVFNAARGYKRYARDAASYNYRAGRNNNILYNPSTSCGSSSVYIDNQATAGLYIYTPYQPNQSALNNLYGNGDSCGAYGNRNFWRMFNDWFGPTSGPLVRTASSGDLYYSDGATKYRVGSMSMAAEYGLGLSSVRIINQTTMDALATSTNPPYLTYILKSTSDSDADGGSLYLVTGGKRYLITSMDQFADFGLDTSQITYLEYSQLMRLPTAGNLSNFVKSSYGGYVFKVGANKKQGILDYNTLSQLNPGGAVTDVSDYILDIIPTGKAIVNGSLVLKDPGGGIWLVTDSVWHYVSSMSAYNCLGLGDIGNISYSTYQTDVGTQGPDATCLVQTSDGQKFIMDNRRRIPVDNAWGFTNFFTPPDSFITRLPVYNPTTTPVFRSYANAPLYIFENGKRRQIYSMSSFSERGYTANDLFNASSDFLSTIEIGPVVLAGGTVVRDTSNGKLYSISGAGKYSIPSMYIFSSYGYNAANILDFDTVTLGTYATLGTLTSQLAYAPGATIFDSGIALHVAPAIESAFGFSGSTPTYTAAVASSGSVRQGTRYMKFGSSAMLYYMENGTKRPVYSWDKFVSLGGSNDNITRLSDSAADLFPTGPAE